MKPITLIPIIVVVAVVVVLGLLAGQVWNPAWNPFKGIAQNRLVEKAIGKLFDLDSFKMTARILADVEASAPGEDTQTANVSLTFETEIDKSDPENMKSFGRLSVDFEGGGVAVKAGGEMIGIGKVLYVRLTSIPFLPFPGVEELTEIKDQWLKIDFEEIIEEITGQQDLPLDVFDEEKQKEISEALKDIAKEKEFFTVEKDYGQEEVDGDKAQHYSVSVNKEGIKKFIPEYLETMKKYMTEESLTDYEENMEEILEDFSQKIDEAWEQIGGIKFDIWVATRNSALKKLRWEKFINLSSFEALRERMGEIEGSVNLVFELVFSDFNEKFDIEEPKDSKPIEEIFGGYYGGATAKAKDARIISALAQARTVMVIVLMEDGNLDNFSCDSGDMKMICEEVMNQGAEVGIAKDSFSASQAACVWSSLIASDGWYCADSEGNAGWTDVYPASEGYCQDGESAVCPSVSFSAPY